MFKNIDTMQINKNIDNIKSLYSFNKKTKKLIEKKVKEKKLVCYLFIILIIVILSKIVIKSRNEIDIINKKT